jgi:hypothetical protein
MPYPIGTASEITAPLTERIATEKRRIVHAPRSHTTHSLIRPTISAAVIAPRLWADHRRRLSLPHLDKIDQTDVDVLLAARIVHVHGDRVGSPCNTRAAAESSGMHKRAADGDQWWPPRVSSDECAVGQDGFVSGERIE